MKASNIDQDLDYTPKASISSEEWTIAKGSKGRPNKATRKLIKQTRQARKRVYS